MLVAQPCSFVLLLQSRRPPCHGRNAFVRAFVLPAPTYLNNKYVKGQKASVSKLTKLSQGAINYVRYLKIVRGLSQITFALGVGRWSEKRVVCYIKSAN